MSQKLNPKTQGPTKIELLILKNALKSWNYKTKEGKRFAKYLWLSNMRLLRRPIDVVGIILHDMNIRMEISDVVEFVKDLRDILRIWTTWLETYKVVDTVYSIRKEVEYGEAVIRVDMDIEDRYWAFRIDVGTDGIRTWLEYFDVA